MQITYRNYAIHSDDMLRGGPNGLRDGAAYKERINTYYPKNKERGDVRSIAFTFEYRVHESDKAYEVGYYRVISKREGKENISYGQFHVVLNKINDEWKIVQDWDADKIAGVKVGEEHFMKFSENGIYELK